MKRKKKMNLNQNGQPLNPAFNRKKRINRGIHEMLGLIKGILMDGRVDDSEIHCLSNWISANSELISVWPISVIKQRLDKVLEDEKIDEDERTELKELFDKTAGTEKNPKFSENLATTLPMEPMIEKMVFKGKIFVLTGKFYFGTRKHCESAIAERQGLCENRITEQTRYLIIGSAGSRDWIHTSWGRKIEKAVEYRDRGIPIIISDEETWSRFLH